MTSAWRALPPGSGFVDTARRRTADPYLVWADLGAFADMTKEGQPAPAEVRVLVQLLVGVTADALHREPGVAVAPAYLDALVKRRQPLRHCTATFDAAACRRFAQPGNGFVERYELVMPVVTRRAPPRPPEPLPAADRSEPPPLCEGDTLLAMIDHGCAFAHAAFRKGSRTRVLRLWDQDRQPAFGTAALPGAVPAAFAYGREVCREELGTLLDACSTKGGQVDEDLAYELARYPELRRTATHGAFVMDQFIGPLRLGDRMIVPPDEMPPWTRGGNLTSDTADLVFVQLPRDAWADPSALALSGCVLDALRHIQSCKGSAVRHVVVNLSCAVHMGPHNGSTLLAAALDELLREESAQGCQWQIVVPAGNAFEDAWHATGDLKGGGAAELSLRVPPACEAPTFLEMWIPGRAGKLAWSVQAPGASRPTPIPAAGRCLSGPHGLQALALRSSSIARGRTSAGAGADAEAGGTLLFLALTGAAAPDLPGAAGQWKLQLQWPRGQKPVRVEVRVGCNESALGARLRHRPARLVDKRKAARGQMSPSEADADLGTISGPLRVARKGTASALVAVAGLYAAAGMRLRPLTAAHYSGEGLKDRKRQAAALSDESRVLQGIRGAGTRSASIVRLQGTSFAAPQIARALADRNPGVSSPGSRVARKPRLKDLRNLPDGPSDRLGQLLVVPQL